MQLALQVLERPYDERSDCWSMGCIILEMATTATHDANQIAEVLVQIKHSPQASIPFSTHFRSRGNVSNTLHRQVYLSQPTLRAGAKFLNTLHRQVYLSYPTLGERSNTLHRQVYLSLPTLGAGAKFLNTLHRQVYLSYPTLGERANTLHRQVYLSLPTLGAGAMFQTLSTGKYIFLNPL